MFNVKYLRLKSMGLCMFFMLGIYVNARSIHRFIDFKASRDHSVIQSDISCNKAQRILSSSSCTELNYLRVTEAERQPAWNRRLQEMENPSLPRKFGPLSISWCLVKA